jgi:hypothetical protein
LVNGRHDGARFRIGLLTGMDGQGGKAQFHFAGMLEFHLS